MRLADAERTSPTWSAPARGRHHTWALPGQTRQTGAHTHPTVRHVTLGEWRPGMTVRYIPTPLHDATASWGAWRIRLVAYGARLESVLGASPRGFESPILRHHPRDRDGSGDLFCVLVHTAPRSSTSTSIRPPETHPRGHPSHQHGMQEASR